MRVASIRVGGLPVSSSTPIHRDEGARTILPQELSSARRSQPHGSGSGTVEMLVMLR